MKGWHAALSALLFFLPPGAAKAAEDSNGAARDLARKTVAFTGRGEPVWITWRNLSTLGSSELAQVRTAFESAIKDAGGRVSDIAPLAEARITLSENRTHYLLAEEIRKGEDRQVWLASWKRTDPTMSAASGMTLEKKQVWQQAEQILDIAFPAGVMLVLSPSKVTLYARPNGAWEAKESKLLSPPKPWPRDLRGRLRVNTNTFQAYLPGVACAGAVAPALTMDCRNSEEAWVLESGSRSLLLANFAPTRNFFDGRVASQTGVRKTVPAFYSAASVEDQGKPMWLLALLDGRTQLFDTALESAGSFTAWGSDIAGTDAHCGGGFQVLATRPGDNPSDAVQAFRIVNRAPSAVTPPAELPGPVTALWTFDGTSVIAIVRNLVTNQYEAYIITVSCGS